MVREFNSLKDDLTTIRKDYYSALDGLENRLNNKVRRDLEDQRSIFVNRMNDQREDLVEYVEKVMKGLRTEVELNNSNLITEISLAKE